MLAHGFLIDVLIVKRERQSCGLDCRVIERTIINDGRRLGEPPTDQTTVAFVREAG